MRITRTRRCIALLLVVQPPLWVSQPVLAQAIDRPAAGGRGGEPGLYTEPPREPSSAGAAFPSPSFPSAGAEPRVPTAAEPPTPPIDEPVDPDGYVLGPGDVVELNFWGVQNIRLRVRLDLEGRVFVPKVGYLKLGGETLTAGRARLRTEVARYYPRLSFGAALSEPRTFVVQVVGAVPQPGSYPARATARVSSAIDSAGGFGPRASQRRISIQRRSGEVVAVDLLRFRGTGDVKYNPRLLDGDVVRVAFEDFAATIEGAVNRPGRYELVGTQDLAELVDVAGGLTPSVSREIPVIVTRRTPDDRQEQLRLEFPEGGGLPMAKLQHEDAVRVGWFGELQRFVTVTGAIGGATAAVTAPPPGPAGASGAGDPGATRRLPYAVGDSVRTVLDRAGGTDPLADLPAAYIVRGGEKIPVDLTGLVVRRDFSADVPMELGDTLVVPFRRRSVLVQGAVFAPGAYPHNPLYGPEQYISLAGGPTRQANALKDARIINPRGEARRFQKGEPVEPGSSVVVTERNFSRAEQVQIGLSLASVLVSVVTVYLAARSLPK